MQAAPTPIPLASGTAMDRRIAHSRTARLRRWALPVTGGLALLGAITAAIGLVPGADTLSVTAATLSIGTAAEAPFQDYLPVRATAAPLHTAYVGAVEGGQVASVAVAEGALLRTGDVLATLSNPQLQLDVTAREAAIAGQLGGISAAPEPATGADHRGRVHHGGRLRASEGSTRPRHSCSSARGRFRIRCWAQELLQRGALPDVAPCAVAESSWA